MVSQSPPPPPPCSPKTYPDHHIRKMQHFFGARCRHARGALIPMNDSRRGYTGGAFLPTNPVPNVEPNVPLALNDTRFPIYWVHVPRCGSSFVNTFLASPHVCSGWPPCATFNVGDSFHDFMLIYPHNVYCPRQISRPLIRTHSAVGPLSVASSSLPAPTKCMKPAVLPPARERLVILLRQPEQRLLSGYYYGKHMLTPSIAKKQKMTALEYAKLMAGCVVKMLTHASTGATACFQGGTPAPLPTPSDVEHALAKLRRDFSFVGLTEEWQLSVCLFHAKMGTLPPCVRSQRAHMVAQTRPASRVSMRARNGSRSSLYDVQREFGGWRDEIDGPVYKEAASIFRADVSTRQLNHDVCLRRGCERQVLAI